jgi:glutamate--cysteine ligase
VVSGINNKLLELSKDPALLSFNRGIEKEALRVDVEGNLAQTPHPEFLGSKLSHPLITTDFSEAQLELITPVNDSAEGALSTLDSVHRFVYSQLDDELLWSASMPCVVPENESIPLAQYGSSNLGRLKTTYRNGLGHRYGRTMQTICAIHYNFSFGTSFWETLAKLESSTESIKDFRSRRYFDLMRNFRRFSWLLVYLFGASPAVCNSFIKGRKHNLKEFDGSSAYLPNATSLRNGNLGYQSDSQSDLVDICYNSLDNYVDTLRAAICTPHPTYHSLKSDGDLPAQVNGNILQSEAEFYTTIRAKRVPPKGGNFLAALSSEGVEYIEVRLLDVNPYLPLGIDAEEIHFLDSFLLFCLLEDSPDHHESLCASVQENLTKTVYEGRSDQLTLDDNGQPRLLKDWANDLLGSISEVAGVLDQTSSTTDYSLSVAAQQSKTDNPENTPSARILKDMKDKSIPFFRFAMNQAINHKASFLANPLDETERSKFESMSKQSITDQDLIERSDKLSFDEYLANIQREYENLGL